jgi:hypothetical protein
MILNWYIMLVCEQVQKKKVILCFLFSSLKDNYGAFSSHDDWTKSLFHRAFL